MKQIYLYPGQWAYSSEPAGIGTILGSCVGVALYDYKRKTGGLNHYLLPNLPPNETPSTRYGDVAIAALIEAMMQDGSEKKSLQAKIFGGANVLSGVTIGQGIGARNIEIAKQLLDDAKIPILEEDTGGTVGRRITLNSSTFEVTRHVQGSDKEPLDITGFGHLESLNKVRVGIVDDSATVRNLFGKIFSKHGIEVVGTAANAFEAREMIVKAKPNVLTLDLEMPKMSGVAFLEKLMKHMPMPVVIVSSLGSQGEAALKTLELGAIEFIQKPSQYDPILLSELGEMLVEKVKAAASVDVLKRVRLVQPSNSRNTPRISNRTELKIIGIGGNAGSAESLKMILKALPSDTPPVVVANGTIAPFLESFLSGLKNQLRVEAVIGKNGDVPRVGCVYFAPPDSHMRISDSPVGARIELSAGAPICGQKPSATALFESMSSSLKAGAVAILLGGFGSDGVEGLQKIKAHGGVTIVESPDTVSFPFAPQKAVSIGVVDLILNAGEISAALIQQRNMRVTA